MLIISTLLICALIVALGIVLGLKIYRDDKSTDDGTSASGEEGSEGDVTTVITSTQSPTTTPTTTPGTTTPFVSGSTEGHYRFAATASDAGPCSTVGTELMARQGGTVVDAAIASLLCQCVHNIHSCGIGGGFFMTVYNRAQKSAYTIIGRETAPAMANETMFIGRSSTLGGLSIGIPGEIKGLWLAHQVGGKLPWKDLVQPSIDFCRNGMNVTEPVAGAMARQTEIIKTQEGLKDLIVNKATGNFYKTGDIIKMPKLANTLEIIANEGVDAFYNGSLTKDIVADIQDARGIITEEDLAGYTAIKEDPIMIKLNDNETVYSPRPPSSGAIYQFILNILDGYHLNKESLSKDEEIKTWNRITEAFKFAFGKRTHLGDGNGEDDDFKQRINELVRNLTSESYAEQIRSQIWDNQTHGTNYYGATFYDKITVGTAHLSILAGNGDAVSVTSTINLYFGSKVVGSRTGIIFNNEMDDFSTPNTVNYYGIPASPANFIKPGKRPLSSMSPSIVVDADGLVNLVVGASGGTKIITSTAFDKLSTSTSLPDDTTGDTCVAEDVHSAGTPDPTPGFVWSSCRPCFSSMTTIASLWLGMSIKEAIDHRRLHHQLLPSSITVENGFPQAIIDGLSKLGHNITVAASAGSIVQGVLQRTEGSITANCDFRKLGYPDGY